VETFSFAALGGDLAYQYGLNGTLAGIGIGIGIGSAPARRRTWGRCG